MNPVAPVMAMGRADWASAMRSDWQISPRKTVYVPGDPIQKVGFGPRASQLAGRRSRQGARGRNFDEAVDAKTFSHQRRKLVGKVRPGVPRFHNHHGHFFLIGSSDRERGDRPKANLG